MVLKRGNTDEVAVIVDTKLQAQVTQEMFMDGYKIAVEAMKGTSLEFLNATKPFLA